MTPHVRFLVGAAVTLLLFVASGFLLAASDVLYTRSSAFADPIYEHQFGVAGLDADVLFVGDSALLFGVVPRRVDDETGARVYNLAVTAYAYPLISDVLIDRYLAHNRKPRLIVLYISPWTRVNPPYPYSFEWYDGAKLIVRHGSVIDIAKFFAAYPRALTQFSTYVWRQFLRSDWSGKKFHEIYEEMEAKSGYISPANPALGTPGRVMPDGCAPPPLGVAPDRDYINAFRSRLSARGIRTAVYIAPMADCDPVIGAVRRAYVGISDNVPYVLPHRYFVDDEFRMHLVAEGSERNAAIVAEFVKRYLQDGITAGGASRMQDAVFTPH